MRRMSGIRRQRLISLIEWKGPFGRSGRGNRRNEKWKGYWPSEVSAEMIIACGKIGIDVMMELRQRVLDGRGIPEEWEVSVVVPIF